MMNAKVGLIIDDLEITREAEIATISAIILLLPQLLPIIIVIIVVAVVVVVAMLAISSEKMLTVMFNLIPK
jgi:hypothetical protein